MTITSDKECEELHKDHWDYVKDIEFWCPFCKRLRYVAEAVRNVIKKND